MLTGEVSWHYQRPAAERAVRSLRGVAGIADLIVVTPRVEPEGVKDGIEQTFKREAALDAKRITTSSTVPAPSTSTRTPEPSGEGLESGVRWLPLRTGRSSLRCPRLEEKACPVRELRLLRHSDAKLGSELAP